MAAYMTGVLPYSSTLSTGTVAVQWRHKREWEEKYVVVNGEEVGNRARVLLTLFQGLLELRKVSTVRRQVQRTGYRPFLR